MSQGWFQVFSIQRSVRCRVGGAPLSCSLWTMNFPLRHRPWKTGSCCLLPCCAAAQPSAGRSQSRLPSPSPPVSREPWRSAAPRLGRPQKEGGWERPMKGRLPLQVKLASGAPWVPGRLREAILEGGRSSERKPKVMWIITAPLHGTFHLEISKPFTTTQLIFSTSTTPSAPREGIIIILFMNKATKRFS